MKVIGFLDPAWTEMMEAARYYNQQSRNLGSRFLDSVYALDWDKLPMPLALLEIIEKPVQIEKS